MFTDPTGGVGYAFGEKLPSSHMNTLTSDHPDAVDGAGGGAYSLGASLTLASSSAYVLWSTSGLTLSDIANVNMLTIGAAGGKWFGAWATGGAGTTVSFAAGTAISSACNWAITAGTFLWQSGARLELDATSPLVVSGLATFYGATTVETGGVLTFNGTGHMRERLVVFADADHTYGIANGDYFLAADLTANRTITLSSAGAATGDVMRFSVRGNAGTTFTLNVGGLVTLQNTAGGVVSCTVVYNGSAWKLFDATKL